MYCFELVFIFFLHILADWVILMRAVYCTISSFSFHRFRNIIVSCFHKIALQQLKLPNQTNKFCDWRFSTRFGSEQCSSTCETPLCPPFSFISFETQICRTIIRSSSFVQQRFSIWNEISPIQPVPGIWFICLTSLPLAHASSNRNA